MTRFLDITGLRLLVDVGSHQIPRVQREDADDVRHVAPIDRQSIVAVCENQLHRLVHAGVLADSHHLVEGGHHLAHRRFRKTRDAGHLFGVEAAIVIGRLRRHLEQHAQFLAADEATLHRCSAPARRVAKRATRLKTKTTGK